MKLAFLPAAERDIHQLHDFLIDENPVTAQKAMLAIHEGLALLLENPRARHRNGA